MLDKELCELFGVDEFKQYIMKELDWAEEQLYDEHLPPIRYIEVKSKYDTLKAVRDKYCEFINKK